ncbi:MAG: Rossmann-like and DUF2520 domain-containing protein [Persicimonas sp.]
MSSLSLEELRQKSWSIVGAGRVGRTLGLLANRLGIPIASTWNRGENAARQTANLLGHSRAFGGSLESCRQELLAGAEVVWITVVDAAIEPVAAQLAEYMSADQNVLHTSGSLSSQVLAEAGVAGHVGSLHPLQAITTPEDAVERLAKVAWTVEGAEEALRFARGLMAQIGVEPVEIQADKKTLYHASAVTAANLLVALEDAAFGMAQAAGMSREQARAMLVPLARTCVDNLERQDTAEALTGPAARGDRETIERHIEALEALGDEELLEIYKVLTARAEGIAGK